MSRRGRGGNVNAKRPRQNGKLAVPSGVGFNGSRAASASGDESTDAETTALVDGDATDFASKIRSALEREGIRPPKWPPNPGSSQSKAVMSNFREQYKKYRDRARAHLIKAGLIDDPDKPKRLEEALEFKGICDDMCPEFEKITRITEFDVKAAEKDPDTGWANTSKMVKKLARSAAGQEAPLPMDVRSAACLRRTTDYLIDDLLRSDDDLRENHGFLWDRTRAIRRDFVFFSSCSADEMRDQVYCLENITRFHVTSLHLMGQEGFAPEDFEEQQEVEQLSKALLSLMFAYDDCNQQKVPCENEAEFRAYHVLLNANQPNILETVQGEWDPRFWRDSDEVRTAVSLVEAMKDTQTQHGPMGRAPSLAASSSYQTYFRILEDQKVSYTMACFGEVHFAQLRRSVLHALKKTFKRPKGPARDITPAVLHQFLRFDNEADTVDFVEQHGLEFKTEAGSRYLDLSKALSYPRIKHSFSKNLVEKKRGRHTLSEIIHRTVYQDPSLSYEDTENMADDNDDSLFVSAGNTPSSALNPAPFAPKPTPSVFGTGFSDATNGPSTTPQPFAPTNPARLNPFGSSGLPAGNTSQEAADSRPKFNPFQPKTTSGPFGTDPKPKFNPFGSTANSGPFGSTTNPFQTGTMSSPFDKPTTFAAEVQSAAPSASPFAPSSGKRRSISSPFVNAFEEEASAPAGSTQEKPVQPLVPAASNESKSPFLNLTPPTPQLPSGPGLVKQQSGLPSTTQSSLGAQAVSTFPPASGKAAQQWTAPGVGPMKPFGLTPIQPSTAATALSPQQPASFPEQQSTKPRVSFAPQVEIAPFPAVPTGAPAATTAPSVFGQQPPPSSSVLKTPFAGLGGLGPQPSAPATTPSPLSTARPQAPQPPPQPKRDSLGALADWVANGDQGLLEEFRTFAVSQIVQEAWDQYEDILKAERKIAEEQELLAEADKFRITSLSTKYFKLWRAHVRDTRLSRVRLQNRDKAREYRETQRAAAAAAQDKAQKERAILARSRRHGSHSSVGSLDTVEKFRQLLLQPRPVDLVKAEEALLATGVLSGLPDERGAAANIVRDLSPALRKPTGLEQKSSLGNQARGRPVQSSKTQLGGAKTRAIRESLQGSAVRRSLPPQAWHSRSPSEQPRSVSRLSDRWRLKAMDLEHMPDGTALHESLAHPIKYDGKRFRGLGDFGVPTVDGPARRQSASEADFGSSAYLSARFARSQGTDGDEAVINGASSPSKRKRAAEEGVDGREVSGPAKRIAGDETDTQRFIREMREFRKEMERETGWFREQNEVMAGELLSRGQTPWDERSLGP